MGFVDILLMGLIICGAVYLLYRSIWKKKGQCSCCGEGTCSEMNKHKSLKDK